MEFNYESERKRFKREQAELRLQYEAAGMSEEAIQEMYEYDWGMFKKRRSYCLHNELFDFNDESMVTFVGELSTDIGMLSNGMLRYPSYFEDSFEASFQNFNDPRLYRAMLTLTDKQKEACGLYYRDQLNEREIAEMLGIGQQRVSKRLLAAKKKIKKEFENDRG